MEMPVSASPGGPAAPDERPVNPKHLLPKADQTIFDVATAVESRWGAVPALTLLWLTKAQFSAVLADFGANLTDKRRTAAERSPNVQRLLELDAIADDALPFLKSYIHEEAGSKEKGAAAYASHGMVRRGKNVEWAKDREERVKGIEMLLEKLRTVGPDNQPLLSYADRKFGLTFWQGWLNEYKPLVQKSGGDAGTISYKVSKKDEAKKTVVKALRAIIYLLKANYPDTFEAELRQWGFRKESY